MSTATNPHKIISPVNVEKRQSINIQSGDTVRVVIRIPEADGKFRLQPFEGIVLACKHGHEAGATFTVRRVIDGVGVEKIFPLYSPMIDEISIVRRAKTRSSKLYHIRDKAARQIRRQMRRMIQVDISTGSAAEDERKAKEEAEAADPASHEATQGQGVKTKEEEEKAAEAKSSNDDEVPSEEQSDDSGKEAQAAADEEAASEPKADDADTDEDSDNEK